MAKYQKLITPIFTLVLVFGGLAMIWIWSSWQIAVGLFFVVWGNNVMEKNSR